CDSKDGLSLFDLTSGASTAPAADADSTVRSQWLTRDAAARLAVRNHLPSTERAHLSQYKSARALYDAVVARYSSPSTAALSRLMLPYLFPDLAAFATVTDLVAHLRTSDTRYRAALPTEFCAKNSPPMYITLYYLVPRLPDSLSSVRDHFLSLCPTELTVDLLEERLAAAEKSILAVGASRGDRRTPFFEGCSPVPLLPSVASAAAVDLVGTEEVGAASSRSWSWWRSSWSWRSSRLSRSSRSSRSWSWWRSSRSSRSSRSWSWWRSSRSARAASGGALGVPLRREPLSPQRLREWYSRRCRAAGGAAGATGATGGAGATGGGAGAGAAGATGTAGGGAGAGAAGAAGAVGATGGAGAAGGGAGAGAAGGAAGAPGGAGSAGGAAGATGGAGAVSGGAARPRPYFVPLLQQPASPLPGPSPYSGPTRGPTERREPESRPVSPESRPASPVRPVRAGRGSRSRLPPVPGTHSLTLRPSTAPQRVPLPSPPASSLPDGPDPESDSLRAASPSVLRFLATAVTNPLFESSAASALVTEFVDFAAVCRLDYAASLVAGSASASVCPPSVGGECALGTDVLEDRQEDLECFTAASPHLVSILLAPEGDPDALDIPTPRSYAQAIEGPYSSQWQAAMDVEMASWKSTGTYADEVPPPGANIVSGMWIFRVKRPPGSPPVFKARYVARGFSQRQGVDFFQTFSPTPKMTTLRVLLHVAAQRDYELHSLDFSTAFLQGSLHEEIWLRRPPGFTGSFPPGTQWSLRRPVYGLRQAPREWHDTLRTTLAALRFAPSTLTLFLRTDATLPPFYVLVLQRFGFIYSSPQSTPLPTGHSLSAPPSDKSVEPSGPYPELVGCLVYLMTCTRPDLAYPLSHLARYVAPGRHRKVHWDAAKRVLRYLCSTSGMGLVLGGRARVVLTGHADASWADDLTTQRSSQGYTFSLGSVSVSWRSTRSSSVLSSSCEAEIYAGAMAAQELRWLTYLLTELGEAPRSPPVLYVDNKAMLALCQEHRLEHRTKHIALRYFLARELQQRGQLRLAYVASQANTADVFTKALQPCDHQRFCTVLGLVPTVPHLLTS
ncbi:unnamed protein product, partial [Closterium sp. NIES-54]